MNRSEWMANKYKNDSTSYHWVPEVMATIDPAPRYHDNGYPKNGHRLVATRRGAEGAAAFRNGIMNV